MSKWVEVETIKREIKDATMHFGDVGQKGTIDCISVGKLNEILETHGNSGNRLGYYGFWDNCHGNKFYLNEIGTCSECRFITPTIEFHYCPYCGAEMLHPQDYINIKLGIISGDELER